MVQEMVQALVPAISDSLRANSASTPSQAASSPLPILDTQTLGTNSLVAMRDANSGCVAPDVSLPLSFNIAAELNSRRDEHGGVPIPPGPSSISSSLIPVVEVSVNGITLRIPEAEIGNSVFFPDKGFTSNKGEITRLCKGWDSDHEYYTPSGYQIGGMDVPLKLLSEIFKGPGKLSKYWQIKKLHYHNYKVRLANVALPFRLNVFQLVAEFFHEVGEAVFWDEFNAVPYTTIHTLLTKRRLETDSRLAKEARREYGDNFDAKFGYNKGLKGWVVMKDVHKIAAKYRELGARRSLPY